MKVAIIVFSPSGHTLQAANIFKKEFENKGICTQLIDITKKPAYLDKTRIKQQLEKDLGEHDVLLIGGPIYAGHMEGHILRLIEQLPEAGKKYGALAVPFATYGGVHSSVALEETGKLLRIKKRKPILGVKIAAEHTLTRTFTNTIYKGRPGKDEEAITLQAVGKIIEITSQNAESMKDAGKSFAYSRSVERLMFKLFSQEAIHNRYKRVSIDTSKCTRCRKCISVCPVNMFDFAKGEVRMARDNKQCILCAECYHHCPAGAILHPYIEVARRRLKDGNAALEKEPSAIYL
ncbi:MAG TPA: EFR1 family ferrodoxin [Anaerovoracaceae bacterium]|nr:EFR1 family ferrodoxin [Anaerovoracaceae bacterium]